MEKKIGFRPFPLFGQALFGGEVSERGRGLCGTPEALVAPMSFRAVRARGNSEKDFIVRAEAPCRVPCSQAFRPVTGFR
ncbi:MAG: hypothetical protein K2L60_07150 [Bacteroides sp.]|nr:hypothetical protein [Bacteroides sp.]